MSLCFLSALILAAEASAQGFPTILQVDYVNAGNYVNDVDDPSKLVGSAGPMAPTSPKRFYTQIVIYDLTAVNGTPVKGVTVFSSNVLNLRPNPNSGQAMSDVTRSNSY